jgi:hypothetical protein
MKSKSTVFVLTAEHRPLQIIDHQEKVHEVLLKPGEMVLYESAKAGAIGSGLFVFFHQGPREVRKLLMLLITPGVDSVCFNVSRLQHKCSWCLVMAVVQHTAVD